MSLLQKSVGVADKVHTTIDRVSAPRGSMPSGVDPAQWDANPYANYDYRHSGWQKFLESLGFRTNYDKFKESMAINAAEYDAQLAEKAHNEEYDSPLAQNQRLREAGINPDLAGETSSGSAFPMEPDPNGPIEPESDFDSFMNLGSMVMNGVQMAFGLMESGIGAISGLQALRGQRIDLDNKVLDTAFKSLGYVFSDRGEEFPNPNDANNYIIGLSELFGSRRSKKYVRAVNQIAQSLAGSEYEYKTRNSRAGQRTEYIDKVISPGYNEVSDTMKDVRHWLTNELWDEAKERARFARLKAQNDADYQQRFGDINGPEVMAQHDVTMTGLQESNIQEQTRGFKAENELKEYRYSLRSSFDHLIQKINKRADEGNNFASFLSVVLGFLGVRMLGM